MRHFILAACAALFTACASFELFTFVQLSDPQIGFLDPSPSYACSDSLMGLAVEAVNALRPACVVITGDLVNNPLDPLQDSIYRARVAQFQVPVHALPGNHDYLGISADEYRARRGATRFSFRERDCAFIGLDSNCIKDGPAAAEAEQLAWLEGELLAARDCRYTFVFLHCPVVRESLDEPEDYFNFSPEKRRQYLNLFKAHGVDYVFAGHTHQDYNCEIDGIRFVAAGPVGTPLGHGVSGFNLVSVQRASVSVSYLPL